MDIGKIDHGAWLTLYPVDEKVGELRLKMLPMASTFEFTAKTDPQVIVKEVGQFVIDWNLEEDGVAVPCTDENKAKYLGHVMRLEVRTDDGKTGFAVTQIGKFPVDIENFLKN